MEHFLFGCAGVKCLEFSFSSFKNICVELEVLSLQPIICYDFFFFNIDDETPKQKFHEMNCM